jgi:hypothetical protein
MSYQRLPVNDQSDDERSGRYAVDQEAPTETELPVITETHAQMVCATMMVVCAILGGLAIAFMILRQWWLS